MNCPSPNLHLPTQVYPLIGIFGYFGVVPWIVQHPDIGSILQNSELIRTEIETYQNPVEVGGYSSELAVTGAESSSVFSACDKTCGCMSGNVSDHQCRNHTLVH